MAVALRKTFFGQTGIPRVKGVASKASGRMAAMRSPCAKAMVTVFAISSSAALPLHQRSTILCPKTAPRVLEHPQDSCGDGSTEAGTYHDLRSA